MNKFLVLAISLLLVGCVAHDDEQPVEEEIVIVEPAGAPVVTQTVEVTSTSETVAPQIPKNYSLPTTTLYMTEMAEKLHDILAPHNVTVKSDANNVILIIPHEVAFGTNQVMLDSQFETTLAAAAKVIKEYDRAKIQIIGYTDNVGSVSSNKALSLRRANAVSNFLRLNDVDINRIVVDGLGPENPLASNVTEAGRKRNHRIEITLINMQ